MLRRSLSVPDRDRRRPLVVSNFDPGAEHRLTQRTGYTSLPDDLLSLDQLPLSARVLTFAAVAA